MDSYEFIWIYMNLYEFMWIKMNSYEFIWIYMNRKNLYGSVQPCGSATDASGSAAVRSVVCDSALGSMQQCAW
jgi:hypothetical protein